MMPISQINVGDIFSNPTGRGYGNYSGLEWVVVEKIDHEKLVKVQGVKFSDKTPYLQPIWKKNTDRMFSESWKIN